MRNKKALLLGQRFFLYTVENMFSIKISFTPYNIQIYVKKF
jgi:hypothetical protein